MPEEYGIKTDEPTLDITPKSDNTKSASKIFYLTMVLVVVALGLFVYFKFHGDSVANDKQANLNSLTDELNSSQNKKVLDQVNQINSAATVLQSASASKYLFKNFIDELTKKITNDTKLNNLAIDSSGKVTFDGNAGSYRSVADLALSLQSSKKLKNVQISALSMSAVAGSNLVTFSMTADIADWKTATTALSNSGSSND
ncbi:MAG: PilN domain-containing protein [Candidatus Berkelbacteria bacterium]|nr:PilN domain-containing protein [Candidatus Berkelbacteria bacterium]